MDSRVLHTFLLGSWPPQHKMAPRTWHYRGRASLQGCVRKRGKIGFSPVERLRACARAPKGLGPVATGLAPSQARQAASLPLGAIAIEPAQRTQVSGLRAFMFRRR